MMTTFCVRAATAVNISLLTEEFDYDLRFRQYDEEYGCPRKVEPDHEARLERAMEEVLDRSLTEKRLRAEARLALPQMDFACYVLKTKFENLIQMAQKLLLN